MSAAAVAAAAALAVLAPVWALAGHATQRLHLPAITGTMLAGVASGPYALGLLSADSVALLAPLTRACLSLIALAAGAELHLPELHRLRRQARERPQWATACLQMNAVAWLTASISFCSWALVYSCMRFLAGSMPWVQGLPPFQVTAACTLAATLSVARSPASAIAVLKELEGKGTYCSLVMAVVVAKDVLLFAAFAINVELAAAVGSRSARGGGAPIWLLLQPAGAILASVALGGAAGWALSKLLRLRHGGGGAGLTPHAHAHHPHSPSAPGSLPRGPGPLARLLRHPTAARLRPALPWLVSGTAFAAAEALRAEPLLTCVAAGLVASNWRHHQQQGRDAAEQLSADLARLAPAVNALFFGLVGASLKLRAVRDGLWAAAILYTVRLGGVWLGCWLGAGASGTPHDTGRRLWMGMAGIALGLAQSSAARFPWGPDFAALWAGVVLMNLLTGPPLFRAAIVAAGEARAAGGGGRHAELQRRASGGGELGGPGLPTAIPTIPIINA